MKRTKTEILQILASLTVLRHGQAEKEPTAGQPDSTRKLTALGRQQAFGLASSLNKEVPDGFDVIICSPFERAVETTAIACGIQPDPFIEFGCSDDAAHPLNVMFKELAYAPLLSLDRDPAKIGYFQHELREHLWTWGDAALERVLVEAKAYKEMCGQPVSVIVGGHAVVQNILLVCLYKALGFSDIDIPPFVMFGNLGTAEALRVVVSGDSTLDFSHIKPNMEVPVAATAAV